MKPAKTLQYIVGALLVFFLVVGGIIFFVFNKSPEEKPLPKASVEQSSSIIPSVLSQKVQDEEITKIEEKVFSEVEKSNIVYDPKCEDTKGEENKIKCQDSLFLQAAITALRKDICDQIVQNSTQQYCKDQIVFLTVRENENFAACKNIQTIVVQKKCHELESISKMQHAKTKGDCADISGIYKKKCLRRFLSVEDFHFAPSKCEGIKDDEDDRIFCKKMAMEYTIKHGNPLDCSTMGDLETSCLSRQANYLDEQYFTTALDEINIHFCSKIIDPQLRTSCKDSLLPILVWQKKDLSFCELLSEEKDQLTCFETKRDQISMFFYRQAIQEKDPGGCIKIPDITRKKLCETYFNT